MGLVGSDSGNGCLIIDGHEVGMVLYNLHFYRPSVRTTIFGTLQGRSEFFSTVLQAETIKLRRLENGSVILIELDGQGGDMAAITCLSKMPEQVT